VKKKGINRQRPVVLREEKERKHFCPWKGEWTERGPGKGKASGTAERGEERKHGGPSLHNPPIADVKRLWEKGPRRCSDADERRVVTALRGEEGLEEIFLLRRAVWVVRKKG